jgi:signal transduction histidine kinase
VRGRAERVASKLGPEHAESPNVRVMIDEIDRVARLIRQLLDFSRASPVEARPVPLDAVVRNVAELLGFEARSRGVRLRNEVGPEIPPLAADADQLKQVLVNLAMNAMHACAPGGTVALRARPDAGRGVAVLEIEDDGAGIPEDLRHRVFDPFFTTKKRGKGTGLGLTVAAQIVRKHGGEIDLASAVGRGTRVIVEWPLAAGGEETDGGAERRAHPGGR